jgi:hypothetical protein
MTSLVLTVDAIDVNADDGRVATLVSDSGFSMVVPIEMLPDDAREGSVLTATFELAPDETEERRRRILDLQKRLFGL